MISYEFKVAVKFSGTPMYRLAQQVGLSPQKFSHLITGYQQPNDDDNKHLQRVAEIIEFPKEKVFESDASRGAV